MPPARRGRPPGSSSSHNNPRTAQQTLAFGRNNKITKPSVPPPSSRKVSKAKTEDSAPAAVEEVTKAEDVDLKNEPESTEVVNEDPALAEGRERGIAIREMNKERMDKRDPMEEKARGVSEAAVKRYWRERELERKAPRGRIPPHAISLMILTRRAIYSTSKRPLSPRKDPPPFRPELAVRPLRWDTEDEAVEAGAAFGASAAD
ncbi:MAG: hypothetical protein Q9166_002683 [cf. Caloplaca sp. 2 TL-2023]